MVLVIFACVFTKASRNIDFSTAARKHEGNSSTLKSSIASECKLSGAPKAAGHVVQATSSGALAGRVSPFMGSHYSSIWLCISSETILL